MKQTNPLDLRIERIFFATILFLISMVIFGTCSRPKPQFASNAHAVKQAIEQFRIRELERVKVIDSLERESLLPKYKFVRGKIVYKHEYDTITINNYITLTDSIISVDSSLIATQDSIIRHYKVYSSDLVIERDSLVESNIDLSERVEKYRQQKKRRLNALVATAGALVSTWLIILL